MESRENRSPRDRRGFSKVAPALSRWMLILGGFLILAGLGWEAWLRLNAPPPPTLTAAGAVVLAVTAPPEPTAQPTVTATPPGPGPTLAPQPSATPAGGGPTPEFLPEWPTVAPPSTPPPGSPPATPSPLPPRPVPTAGLLPPAHDPPTRIVAPAIGLDARVVPMGWELVSRQGTFLSEWVVPENAAGWHKNSALPGHGGNVVLSGHHNIAGKVFRHVVDLAPGDEITLYADGRAYRYVVTEKYILKEAGMPLSVRKTNAQWIMPTADERLTLVTCWPYEWPGNSHRVIVVARPVSGRVPADQEQR